MTWSGGSVYAVIRATTCEHYVRRPYVGVHDGVAMQDCPFVSGQVQEFAAGAHNALHELAVRLCSITVAWGTGVGLV